MLEALASSNGVVDPITETVTNVFLSQGLMGVFCLILMYVIFHLRRELRDVREAHKEELASKDAQVDKQVDERIKDLKAGFDALNGNKATMEALLSSIRRGP